MWYESTGVSERCVRCVSSLLCGSCRLYLCRSTATTTPTRTRPSSHVGPPAGCSHFGSFSRRAPPRPRTRQNQKHVNFNALVQLWFDHLRHAHRLFVLLATLLRCLAALSSTAFAASASAIPTQATTTSMAARRMCHLVQPQIQSRALSPRRVPHVRILRAATTATATRPAASTATVTTAATIATAAATAAAAASTSTPSTVVDRRLAVFPTTAAACTRGLPRADLVRHPPPRKPRALPPTCRERARASTGSY